MFPELLVALCVKNKLFSTQVAVVLSETTKLVFLTFSVAFYGTSISFGHIFPNYLKGHLQLKAILKLEILGIFCIHGSLDTEVSKVDKVDNGVDNVVSCLGFDLTNTCVTLVLNSAPDR